MDEMNSAAGRGKAWSIYNSSTTSSSHAAATDVKDGPWKSYGSSMSAISFGFVATAILISMFLIMAIFEHLFRPTEADDDEDGESSRMESRQMHKLGNPEIVQTTYASDFSVVMPGQQYPTFIAQPAPLPCPREGAYWPYHGHSLV